MSTKNQLPSEKQAEQKLTAAVQAEIMERQKMIQEREMKIKRLTDRFNVVHNRQLFFEREQRRGDVTKRELSKCGENATVYKSLGRAFLQKSVPSFQKDLSENATKMAENIKHVQEEKVKIEDTLVLEREHLKRDTEDFIKFATRSGLIVANPQ